MSFIKTFDQVTKHNFDQTPVLLENFDQVIRSSEIRSSDPLSFWSTATSTSIYFSLIIISGKNRPRQLLQTFLNELLCTILQKKISINY